MDRHISRNLNPLLGPFLILGFFKSPLEAMGTKESVLFGAPKTSLSYINWFIERELMADWKGNNQAVQNPCLVGEEVVERYVVLVKSAALRLESGHL